MTSLIIKIINRLLVLLATEPSTSVSEVDVKLSSALHNSLALKGGHVVCYLGAVFAVVHHQQFDISNVVDDNLEEAVGESVPSLLVCTVSNVGHDNTASFEFSTNAGINTLGSTPAFLQIINKNKHKDVQVTDNQTSKSSNLCSFAIPSSAYLDGDLAIALMALEGVGALLYALHFN
jgi:hypothetical protein